MGFSDSLKLYTVLLHVADCLLVPKFIIVRSIEVMVNCKKKKRIEWGRFGVKSVVVMPTGTIAIFFLSAVTFVMIFQGQKSR